MHQRTADRRQYKHKLYVLFSEMASALAKPHRLALLDLLVQAPLREDISIPHEELEKQWTRCRQARRSSPTAVAPIVALQTT